MNFKELCNPKSIGTKVDINPHFRTGIDMPEGLSIVDTLEHGDYVIVRSPFKPDFGKVGYVKTVEHDGYYRVDTGVYDYPHTAFCVYKIAR